MKLRLIVSFLCTILVTTNASSQEVKEEKTIAAAVATNPLSNITKLQLQPIFTFIHGGGRQLTLFTRIVQPSKSIGLPFFKSTNPKYYTIYRLEAPIISQTVTDKASAFNATGTGDFILLDIMTSKTDWGHAGLGPGLLIPMASPETLGLGKWCAGPIGIFVYTKVPKLQFGALAQQFFSFAGDDERPEQNFMFFQPVITKLFDKGFFMQSFPIMRLDWRNDKYNIPINLMFGKAFAKDRSMYIGPQYVVSGPNKNNWSIILNINTMFQ